MTLKPSRLTVMNDSVLANKPRGLRNNNPLNLRKTGTNWQGQRSVSSDVSFCEFISLRWGFRAAFITLMSYWRRGWRTVEDIIYHWAPPSDGNNTAAYIHKVNAFLRDEVPFFCSGEPLPALTALNSNVWCSLAKIMASIECGVEPDYFEESAFAGFQLATGQF